MQSNKTEAKVEFIESIAQEKGRYELYWVLEKAKKVMIVQGKKSGNLLLFDPQSGKHRASTAFESFQKNYSCKNKHSENRR